MNESDESAQVLRMMEQSGVDLKQSRDIGFPQNLAFISSVDKDLEDRGPTCY